MGDEALLLVDLVGLEAEGLLEEGWMLGGRSCARTSSVVARVVARSMALRSSRTLPGQG
jgi:hypothetical protein